MAARFMWLRCSCSDLLVTLLVCPYNRSLIPVLPHVVSLSSPLLSRSFSSTPLLFILSPPPLQSIVGCVRSFVRSFVRSCRPCLSHCKPIPCLAAGCRLHLTHKLQAFYLLQDSHFGCCSRGTRNISAKNIIQVSHVATSRSRPRARRASFTCLLGSAPSWISNTNPMLMLRSLTVLLSERTAPCLVCLCLV